MSVKLNGGVPDAKRVKCDNCGWVGKAVDVKDVDRLEDRIEPGGEVPVGECPDCGALAYLDAVNPFAKLTPEERVQYAGQVVAVELATGDILHVAPTAADLEGLMRLDYPNTEYGQVCLPGPDDEKPSPWSVLYTVKPGCDTCLLTLGPYPTEGEAIEAARAAQADGTFDVQDQRIYLIGPEHELHEIETCELVPEEA